MWKEDQGKMKQQKQEKNKLLTKKGKYHTKKDEVRTKILNREKKYTKGTRNHE